MYTTPRAAECAHSVTTDFSPYVGARPQYSFCLNSRMSMWYTLFHQMPAASSPPSPSAGDCGQELSAGQQAASLGPVEPELCSGDNSSLSLWFFSLFFYYIHLFVCSWVHTYAFITDVLVHTCPCTHTCTCIHTFYTQMHSYTHRYLQTYMYLHTPAHIHTCRQTHMYLCTHRYYNIHTPQIHIPLLDLDTHVHTCAHIHMKPTHIYLHLQMHLHKCTPHTLTHVCTHICTHSNILPYLPCLKNKRADGTWGNVTWDRLAFTHACPRVCTSFRHAKINK